MEIINASEKHIPVIRTIAYDTWPKTFGDILSQEQMEYMLEMMYSVESLTKQMGELKHNFLLAKEDNNFYGYASYELNYMISSKTKIHKLYISPDSQGKGVGKMLIDSVQKTALLNHNTTLTLGVKRDNKAVDFYKKIGFVVVDSVDIAIGDGFFMRDFIMDKAL